MREKNIQRNTNRIWITRLEREKFNCKRDRYLKVFICMLISILVINIFADSTSQAADADEASDYSFYMLASNMSAALSTFAADPAGGDVLTNAFQGLYPSAAGGVLGYVDTSVRGVYGLSGTATSNAATSYSYKQLSTGNYGQINDGSNTHVFSTYCALGAGLADLGIDKTSTDAGEDATRMMIGVAIRLFYEASHIVTVLFGFIIKFLKTINPFQFFSAANDWMNSGDALDYTMLEVDNNYVSKILIGADSKSVLAPLIKSVSQVYGALYDTSSVVLIIFFAVMMVRLLLPKTSSRESKLETVRKYVFRVAFVVVGIPVLGCSYTAVLDKLDENMTNQNSPAAKVIASTFCDFESWVMKKDMRLPEELKVQIKDGTITAADDYSVQDLCYEINFNNLSFFNGSENRTVKFYLLSDKLDTTNTESIITSVQESKGTPAIQIHDWVVDILDRYKDGKKVYASNYEQEWIANKWMSTPEPLQKYIEQLSSVESIKANSPLTEYWKTSPYPTDKGSVYNPFAAAYTSSVDTIDMTTKPGEKEGDVELSGDYSVKIGFKLSPMSIYNYLNSTFTDSGITVYSSRTSSSNHVRNYHYSVNVVGNGMSSAVMLLTCMSLLASYAVLGFVYGFNIMFTNIKKGMQMIAAVPGAMLGSLQSIAKVISYSVLMIVEVVIHILLYMITTDFMYSMTIVVLRSFNNAVDNILGSSVNVSWFMSVVSGMLVSGFLIVFCQQSIKMRGSVIKSCEQMADNVIRRFVVGTSGYGMGYGMGYNSGYNPSASTSTASSSNSSDSSTVGKDSLKDMAAEVMAQAGDSPVFGDIRTDDSAIETNDSWVDNSQETTQQGDNRDESAQQEAEGNYSGYSDADDRKSRKQQGKEYIESMSATARFADMAQTQAEYMGASGTNYVDASMSGDTVATSEGVRTDGMENVAYQDYQYGNASHTNQSLPSVGHNASGGNGAVQHYTHTQGDSAVHVSNIATSQPMADTSIQTPYEQPYNQQVGTTYVNTSAPTPPPVQMHNQQGGTTYVNSPTPTPPPARMHNQQSGYQQRNASNMTGTVTNQAINGNTSPNREKPRKELHVDENRLV